MQGFPEPTQQPLRVQYRGGARCPDLTIGIQRFHQLKSDWTEAGPVPIKSYKGKQTSPMQQVSKVFLALVLVIWSILLFGAVGMGTCLESHLYPSLTWPVLAANDHTLSWRVPLKGLHSGPPRAGSSPVEFFSASFSVATHPL